MFDTKVCQKVWAYNEPNALCMLLKWEALKKSHEVQEKWFSSNEDFYDTLVLVKEAYYIIVHI